MNSQLLPIDRFLQTLHVVSREASHLKYSYEHLFSENINEDWVAKLEQNPEKAEILEAFISRFGRMQDTIADKLLPRWLLSMAETPGSQIETLNRAEKLGVITDVEAWLQARKLRNVLVHEYMEDANDFAENLLNARSYTQLLMDCYNRLQAYAKDRMNIETEKLPQTIDLPLTV